MGRTTARELIRAAQTAELHKDLDRAVALLEEAARIHLASDEPGRAAALFRHCLRLTPGRADLERARDDAERAAETQDLGESSAPSLPLSSDMAEALAEVEALVAEKPEAEPAQPAAAEPPEQPQPPARVRTLELPQRGPTAADPAIECWCSFCCRPKAEVGPMIAGPAGAFICGACIEGAAAIAGRQIAAIQVPAPSPAPSALLPERGEPRDFIEAAVLLSRALGWSLAEVRSLSAEERERALAVLAGLERRKG